MGNYKVMVTAKLNDKGQEILDPVPMAPPVGYVAGKSMEDQVRDMVRSEHLRIAAMQAEAETYEEADDFEVGDDYDPTSPYEEEFDPVDSQVRMQLRQADFDAKVRARLEEVQPVIGEGNGSSRPESTSGVPSGGDSADARGPSQSEEGVSVKPAADKKSAP